MISKCSMLWLECSRMNLLSRRRARVAEDVAVLREVPAVLLLVLVAVLVEAGVLLAPDD